VDYKILPTFKTRKEKKENKLISGSKEDRLSSNGILLIKVY